MGKDRTIRIIADLVAGMTAHKILVKYTNKPESINHMESEVENYRGAISDYIAEFNWNDNDIEKIKREAEKSLKKSLREKHFKDISFPSREKIKMLDETIKKFF